MLLLVYILIQKKKIFFLEHLNIEECSWSKSLFKRMGYVRRLATTGKVEISERLKAEIETVYLYGIVQKINEAKIPSFSFPSDFVIRANEKRYSNEREALNILENVIIPCVEKQRVSLNLDFDHPALLIMDVFKGQMTCAVRELLNENHILLEKVPVNLTYLFQPLDKQGGPNDYVKRFMKKKFTLWYSDQVIRALDEGKDIKDVEISLKLSIVKPFHAKWLIEMYNHMTSSEGRDVCFKGWKVAGILDAAEKGLDGLPNLDPFHDIDLLATSDSLEEADGNESKTERNMYISLFVDDDEESEYEDEDGNILMYSVKKVMMNKFKL